MTPCRYCGESGAYDTGFRVECVSPKCSHFDACHAAEVLSRRMAPPSLRAVEAPSGGPYREDGLVLRPIGAQSAVAPRAEYVDTDSPKQPCVCGHPRRRHAECDFNSSRAPSTACTAVGCDCVCFCLPPPVEESRRCCPSHAAREVLESGRHLVRAGEQVRMLLTSMVEFRGDYVTLWPRATLSALHVVRFCVGGDCSALASVGGYESVGVPGECFDADRPFRLAGRLRFLQPGIQVFMEVRNVSDYTVHAQFCVHGSRTDGERFSGYGKWSR